MDEFSDITHLNPNPAQRMESFFQKHQRLTAEYNRLPANDPRKDELLAEILELNRKNEIN